MIEYKYSSFQSNHYIVRPEDKFVRNKCFNRIFLENYRAYNVQDGVLKSNELKTNNVINTNENRKV
jgi:hypothetical protein